MTPINSSTVAIAERYAKEHFDLSLPIKVEELKSAFRTAAKKFHTDTSGSAGTKEKFIAMKSAYDFLVKLEGMDFVYGERAVDGGRLATTDGTPLYELGLGLGAMRNGRDCERCQHKGYTEERNFLGQHSCTKCDWHGRVLDEVPCKPCGGTGRFTQARSGHTVPCRTCHGRGNKLGYRLCPDCNGKKYVGEGKVHYVKCYECNGTGEIELFSPLLPKGRIINVVRR